MMGEKRRSRAPDIPGDLCQRLDSLLVTYVACSKEARYLRSMAHARTAEMRLQVREVFREADEKAAKLERKREAVAREFSDAWDEHFPDVPCAVFPSATVARRTRRKVEVLHKGLVIERLEELDRLDLVDQVIDEKGLVRLSRTGALDDLPEDVLRVTDTPALQVNPRKEGE